MDPLLHFAVKSAVSWVDSSWWKPFKATKDTNISRQSFILCILGYEGILFIDYLGKGRTINREYYIALLVCLKEEITSPKNSHIWRRKKCSFTKTMSQVDHNDNKTTWIALRIVFTPTLFSRSGSQWLLAVCRHQIMLQGKRFGSNEEVILETEMYFETKDKSFYKKGIKLLEKYWSQTRLMN